jgi:alpha-galactosidase
MDLEQSLSAVWHAPHIQKWTLSYLAGRWGAETQVRTVDLDQGKFLLESRHGATSHQTNPWFAVAETGKADESRGEVWFGELAWSGSWKIAAEITDTGRLHVSGGIHDFDFNWRLKPGDEFSTPLFVAGFSAEGMGGASRRLHAYQLAEVLPKPQNKQLRPVIYNSWYATTFDINVEQQIKLARQARDLGVELFMMDDGWFGKRDSDRAGLGDWFPSKTKFPQGLKPLTDAVHDLGMTFGLWVEPEMVNPDSDLYRAHPDWVFHFPNRPRTEQRNQLILNFSKPEVQDHLFTVLDKLLTENGIDFIKWDMNRHIAEPGWSGMPPEQQKEIWVRHARGVYALIDRLREKHPNVLWESCSGGGGRADIGILRRMDQVWASDNTDPFDRLFIQEGYTHAYSPKTMVGWVTDNPDGINQRSPSLAYRFNSAMMGALGVGGNLLKFSDAEKKESAFWVSEYKQIRPLVQEGALYRLRSPRESGFSAVEYVSPDRSSAVVFAFLHSAQFGDRLPAVRLQGLKPQAQYKASARQPGDKPSIQPQTLTGAALMERGLTLNLKGDFASALIRVELAP